MQKSSFRYSDYNKSYKRWKRAIGDRGNVHQEQKYKINYQNQVRMSQNLKYVMEVVMEVVNHSFKQEHSQGEE